MKRLDGQDLLVQGLKVAHHDTAHQGIFLWAHLGMMCENVNGCVILRPDNFDPLLNNYYPIKTISPKAGKERQHWCANQL